MLATSRSTVTAKGDSQMSHYQERKVAELKRLGWSEVGKRHLPGPGRKTAQHVYELSCLQGKLQVFVYPAELIYLSA